MQKHIETDIFKYGLKTKFIVNTPYPDVLPNLSGRPVITKTGQHIICIKVLAKSPVLHKNSIQIISRKSQSKTRHKSTLN